MQFTELELHSDLRRGIDDMGFVDCTPVQERTFTHTLEGRDVTVQSQTGTGKTAAFLITIFQLLSEDERYKGRQAYIVAPTRELAVQIEREAQRIGAHLPFRIANFYGGVGYGPQEKALKEGVDVIIGTPGRLLDFHSSRKLPFDNIGIVVIDEADRLFDMGFYPDIRRMMRDMLPKDQRMTMLFSATLSTKVRNIAWQYMNDPEEVDIEPEHITVDTVEQELFHVARNEKLGLVLGLLERYKPENGLIFTNTKQAAEEVALRLQYNGFSAEFIMGDLPQRKRMKLIDGMKDGSVRFLVATDVAARGLHVDNLDIVINYDLPEDPENYVHRIGRTARAGASGRAAALACERYVYSLESIEDLIGMKIPVGRVTDDDFKDDASSDKHLGQVRKELGIKHERAPTAGGSHGGRSTSRSSKSGRRSGGDRARGGERSRGGGERSRSGEERRRHDAGKAGAGGSTGSAAAASSARKSSSRGDDAAKSGAGSAEGAARTGGERKHPQAHHKPTRQTHHHKPTAKTSVEDRLEYYRRKYGEDFELSESTAGRSGGGGRGANGGRSGDAGRSANGGSGENATDSSKQERRDGDDSSVWRRIGRIFGGS
jgi:ATP-dependent RNA helicase RhlB